MRFDRQHQTPEALLADAVKVALENTNTPYLAADTRLEIVRGVLKVAWEKYVRATAASSVRTRSGTASSPSAER